MSLELLDKTRKLNRLLHECKSHKVMFNDICLVLGEAINTNILVFSKKGKLLGKNLVDEAGYIKEFDKVEVSEFISDILNERLMNILSTQENMNLKMLGIEFAGMERTASIITPIVMAEERLGTIVMYKSKGEFSIDDIILTEYGTTVVGMEIMKAEQEERTERNRKRQEVQSAFSTLSFTECEAIKCIFEEVAASPNGVIVATKLAEKTGITRSIIVNALKKFESAGIVKVFSSGMKGTHIVICNDAVFAELEELKKN